MEKTKVITKSKQAGFTLIEIIVTLTVGMILVSITAPSLANIVQNNRMVALHNDLLSDLALARSTAVTRGSNATLCASNAIGNQCLSSSAQWPYGWIVFDDVDNDGLIDSAETIIAVNNNMSEQLQMIASNSRVSFDAGGFANGFSNEFTFCDKRGDSAKKGLIVSNAGRSRIAETSEIATSCP